MNEDDNIVDSPLNREVIRHGRSLSVQIYGTGRADWVLEVVNDSGTSLIWDGTFDTDQLALEEFERCLREDGIESFD